MRTLEYQAIEQDDGVRLELILKRRLGLSVRQIRQLKFLSDGITVNGQKQRIVYSVHSGDRIRVTFSEQNRNVQELPFLEKPLHILYEDEDLLVVDKKAGEVCHPAHGHYQDTLANQAAAYLAGCGSEKAPIRCIGRLDKDTSGTLLFAKNRLAAERLARQKEEGVFRKEYLALVNGIFPVSNRSGEICLPLAPLPGSLMKMQVSGNGKRALTRYEVLCSDRHCSLVLCRIETGRTHQIRVHMAAIGHPLVGDPLYGNDTHVSSTRTALHAWRLYLKQPVTGEELMIESFRENMFS
ncbi:MAG: RluA family pseudouridine synthase [Lacrimispora saccharolytica]